MPVAGVCMVVAVLVFVGAVFVVVAVDDAVVVVEAGLLLVVSEVVLVAAAAAEALVVLFDLDSSLLSVLTVFDGAVSGAAFEDVLEVCSDCCFVTGGGRVIIRTMNFFSSNSYSDSLFSFARIFPEYINFCASQGYSLPCSCSMTSLRSLTVLSGSISTLNVDCCRVLIVSFIAFLIWYPAQTIQ